jgi:hypothetical protein
MRVVSTILLVVRSFGWEALPTFIFIGLQGHTQQIHRIIGAGVGTHTLQAVFYEESATINS